ncbi:MAG: thioredoxin family protein [Saccharospirillaceae bacterium]|nr:thioredoxin family protein [Pseudomonadales bacterium]NRB80808.1 thioredoxin family protein [Saccharospirillaceae bacterium]
MNKLISLLFMFMFSLNVIAAESPGEVVEFLEETDAYQMSYESFPQNNEIVINWDVAEGYYLYKDKISVSSVDKKLELICTPNFKSKYDETFEETKEVYYDYAQVRLKIEATQTTPLLLEYQGCADAGLCYPPQEREIAYYPSDEESQIPADFDYETAFEDDENYLTFTCAGVDGAAIEPVSISKFIVILLMALGGGLILNLMPCVFPVLAMKAMTFVQAAGHAKIENIRHSWAYTIGVVVSFLAVGGALLALKWIGGVDVSWGKQLSSPYVLMAMIYIFFFIGLMLYGYTTVGTSLMGVGQGLTEDSGLKGSFFTGVLATMVATPCTGPLMAPPLLFALTQPPVYGLIVFAVLGFGMALPMLLIAYIPAAARMMPRPGAWMEVFKQGMSFPMFAAVIWLGDVLLAVVGADGVVLAGGALLGLMFYLWPSFNKAKPVGFGKFFARVIELSLFVYVCYLSAKTFDSLIVVLLASAVALVVLIAYYKLVAKLFTQGFYEMFGKVTNAFSKIVIVLLIVAWVPYKLANPPVDHWIDFKTVNIEQLAQEGPVFVDVTAEWCITCKANESISMHSDRFYALAEQKGVILVKADFTTSDPEILKFLRSHDRVSVPLYVFYVPGEAPVYLPQAHTADTVTNVFNTVDDVLIEGEDEDQESSKNEALAEQYGL